MIAIFSIAFAQQMSGAIWTSNDGCTAVNMNHYESKMDVYLNGGPPGGSNKGLPTGWYHVQVTEPDGEVLGKSDGVVVQVGSNGSFVTCYQLWNIVKTKSSNFAVTGYDDTTNNGDVYKVWLSSVDTFSPSLSKTDNFKVKDDGPPPQAVLNVDKYYDVLGNGTFDPGTDTLLSGWWIKIVDVTDSLTWYFPTAVSEELPVATYQVTECMPSEPGWFASTATSATVTLSTQTPTRVEFGNYCRFQGDLRTIGFYRNNCSRADVGACFNVTLGTNGNGCSQIITNCDQVRATIIAADSREALPMLRAQLLAAKLNVCRVPGLGAAPVAAVKGAQTVQQIIGAAEAFIANLAACDLRPSNWPVQREQALIYANILDAINNGTSLGAINPTPCSYTNFVCPQ